MLKFPTVTDPTGRVVRTVTSSEELDALKAQGYKPFKEGTETKREPLNTGSAGQVAARKSSTTEGSERNSGSTTGS